MFGLDFSAAALVNAVAGGVVGAAATLAVGWWSTKEIRSDLQDNVDVLVTVSRGLEEAFRTGRLEFNRDDEGKPQGIHVYLGGTSEGSSSDSGELTERAVAGDSVSEEVTRADEDVGREASAEDAHQVGDNED